MINSHTTIYKQWIYSGINGYIDIKNGYIGHRIDRLLPDADWTGLKN